MSVKNLDNKGGDVIRCGMLKKLKTSRRKWFVLRAETPDSSARLEYYDSEKKFNSGLPPKRSIPLKSCFNINKRHDTKNKHVIALYTKDDCFCVQLETEEELDSWLKTLLSLQHGEDTIDGDNPRPTFEHVWQVTILNRGLGTGRTGNYRLCLTDKILSLIKKDCQNSSIDLNLTNIRSCGSLKNYFFLEIGRSSLLGAGELWMDSEDTNIAQNIHTTIFHAMSTNTSRDELAPKSRTRSSSATESSKPNVYRKQVISGIPKSHIFTQEVSNTTAEVQSQTPVTQINSSTITAAPQPVGSTTGRERCDSMPSRPRTTSEGTHPLPVFRPYLVPYHRSHGRDMSHSPPSGSPISPPSVGCSTDSTGSSYSLADETDVCTECPEPLRYSIPLTPDEAIAEEDCPETLCDIYNSYVPMAPHSSDDGYVDMSPRCHHITNSPTASMSSINSGTPSTDIRFCDYPLDKVSSYLTSEDDDTRPIRAYSVGSRPETYHSKRHVELAGHLENSRVRAFSVGSKTKKGPIRVLPPHYPHPGCKSSSAPMLTNTRTHSSHGSIGPMDDLMEMDFSRSNTGSSTNSGYIEMKSSAIDKPSGYVEMKPGVDLLQNKNNFPSEISSFLGALPGTSPYVDMSGSSPARNTLVSPQLTSDETRNNNYVDMDQRKHRTASQSSNNTRPSTSPGSYQWGSDYLDMTGNQPRRSERGSFSSQLSSSPNVHSISPKSSDYMPLNLYQQNTTRMSENQARAPDGYVDMSLGTKHQRQSSLDSTKINKSSEDYTNMSLASGVKKKSVKKEKARSQPISINPATCTQETKNSSSPISISSLLGRKSSTGTPPRMHLPITSWATSSYSSLPRQRPRKDSLNNSRDSSSSSINTPSSSSTIFPMSLNSPSSPMKPNIKTSETLSTGLKIPAAILNTIYRSSDKSTSAKFGGHHDSNTTMDIDNDKQLDKNKDDISDYVNFAPSVKIVGKPPVNTDDSMGDYAIMKPGTLEANIKMNHMSKTCNLLGSTSPLVSHLLNIGISDSPTMCFKPIKEDFRLQGSSTLSKTADEPTILVEDILLIDTTCSKDADSPYEILRATECVSPAAKVSRPNSVNNDKIKNVSLRFGTASGENYRPSSTTSDPTKIITSRPSSTSSELCSSTSTLVDSRPDSVNSDQIWSDLTQPTKSDNKLHYASLDLTQEEEGSRSPRTVQCSPSDPGGVIEPTFIYAEIDFVKSEDMKHNNQSLPSNTKVKY